MSHDLSPQNIEYPHGDDAIFWLTLLNADDAIFNPTGCSFWFTVKVSKEDADTGVYQLTSAGGAITIADATNGIVQIKIPAGQTYNPTFEYKDTPYYYDVQMKDASNNISTVAMGRVTVLADVTRTIS